MAKVKWKQSTFILVYNELSKLKYNKLEKNKINIRKQICEYIVKCIIIIDECQSTTFLTEVMNSVHNNKLFIEKLAWF